MRNSIQWILVLAGGFCFIVNAYHAWDYLPADNEISGWTRDTTEKYKIWSDDSLYGFIDGGADVYLDKGFREGTIMSYTRDDIEISVNIYDQTLPDSAKALYHELSQECVEDIASLGDSACIEIALFSSCLKVIYNNFYIFIESLPNDSLSLGVDFASTIIRKIDNPIQIGHVSPFSNNVGTPIRAIMIPGVDMVKILYNGKDQRVCCLRIFDLSGQLIEEQSTLNKKSAIWDISDITSGFYFIELRSDKNRYYTRIMVMK